MTKRNEISSFLNNLKVSSTSKVSLWLKKVIENVGKLTFRDCHCRAALRGGKKVNKNVNKAVFGFGKWPFLAFLCDITCYISEEKAQPILHYFSPLSFFSHVSSLVSPLSYLALFSPFSNVGFRVCKAQNLYRTSQSSTEEPGSLTHCQQSVKHSEPELGPAIITQTKKDYVENVKWTQNFCPKGKEIVKQSVSLARRMHLALSNYLTSNHSWMVSLSAFKLSLKVSRTRTKTKT